MRILFEVSDLENNKKPCKKRCIYPLPRIPVRKSICPPGAQGPPGPQGPGSTLFFADEQGQSIVVIPPLANNITIMDVQVTTTEPNQRVKLDASMVFSVFALPTASFFQFSYTLILFRDNDALTAATQRGNYVREVNDHVSYDWHPNFTFVDIPGAPGTYTYRVAAFETAPRINVTEITAGNRGLTATVFPPV